MKRFMVCLISIFCILGLLVKNISAGDTVKVGIVLPLTGSQAEFGEIEKKSFNLALEEINASGGINGKKLELVMKDDTGRSEVGRSMVEKLITKDKVVMIGGGFSSSVTYAVAGVCQQNKMPFLVNTGSADKITASGWDFIYRLNPPVSHYADAVTTLLAGKVKPKTVAILHENSRFGTKGAKSFEKICRNTGYKVVLKEGYEHGGMDYKPVLIQDQTAQSGYCLYGIEYHGCVFDHETSQRTEIDAQDVYRGFRRLYPAGICARCGNCFRKDHFNDTMASSSSVSRSHGLL